MSHPAGFSNMTVNGLTLDRTTERDVLVPSALAAYVQLFPMRPKRGSISCRAILDWQIIHIRDLRRERIGGSP